MLWSIPQLASLRHGWDALAESARSPLLDDDWFMSCAGAFHRAEDLKIFTAYERNRFADALEGIRREDWVGKIRRLTSG
jgi:hypothetical protein